LTLKKSRSIFYSFALILSIILIVTVSDLPAKAQTSAETVVLSNEFPGNSIVKLTNAGYGNDSVYQVLVDIQSASNPSIASAVTPEFLATLENLPASSQIFTTQLVDYDIYNAIAISTDGTVQTVTYTGSSYYKAQGTSSLDTQVSGIGSFRAIYSSSQTPLTTFTMGNTTYNVFAILYTPSTATAASSPTNTTPPASTTPATPEFSTIILLPFALMMLFTVALIKRKSPKI
jgi:hypothetical protein